MTRHPHKSWEDGIEDAARWHDQRASEFKAITDRSGLNPEWYRALTSLAQHRKAASSIRALKVTP